MDAAIISRGSFLRNAPWDALFLALASVHAALMLAAPSIPLIALGLWWNANTVAHNFIHSPFFRSRTLNALFSGFESLLLGFPQTLWKERHLAHHAGRSWRFSSSPALAAESLLVLALWSAMGFLAPRFFLLIYLPGFLLGLALCALQGHFEHRRGATSHYGRTYNLLFFNDGYHVEHHERPGEHWSRLQSRAVPEAAQSCWPPVLRWLEYVNLERLERLVLHSRVLQRLVIKKHERAFRAFLPQLADVRSVEIVGGGLFPRTALILARLLPEARLRIIDASARNLEQARRFVGEGVESVHRFYRPNGQSDADLVVIPLAFRGNRSAIYENPPARLVMVHDWLWMRRGIGRPVSLVLLKRLNLVRR